MWQLSVKRILYIQLKTSWDIKLHIHPKNDEFWLSLSVFPLEIAHTTLNTQNRDGIAGVDMSIQVM